MLKQVKAEIELDLSISHEPRKDGQVSVKLARADEVRFKIQKARHGKQINEMARNLILRMLETLENQDQAS